MKKMIIGGMMKKLFYKLFADIIIFSINQKKY